MNLWQALSLLLSVAVLGITIFTSTDSPKAFLDPHGILVVLGGTLAATAVSFQLDQVLKMLKVFWDRTVRGKRTDYAVTIRMLMKIADAYQKESPRLRTLITEQPDPFMRESFEALMDQISDPEHIYRMQRRRVETIYERYMQDALRFRAVGKYPPAMGLLGAVTGMIALLASLGKPGAEKTIGPAMSVALVATMYGIAFANFFVLPIAENLTHAAKELRTKNIIICESLRLISKGLNPMLLAEELNSFLLPHERVDWRQEST